MRGRLLGFIAMLLVVLPATANELLVSVSGMGTVSGSSDSVHIIACRQSSGTCSGTTPEQVSEEITLSAVADDFYVFDGWTGDCLSSGSSPTCSLMIEGHGDTVPPVQNVGASFSPGPVPISVTIEGEGSVSGGDISCPGVCTSTALAGSTLTLSASPQGQYWYTPRDN